MNISYVGCIGIPLQLINYTLLMVLPVNKGEMCWSGTFENVFLLRGHYTRHLPLFSIFFEKNCHGRSKSPWVMSCLWSQLMFNIIGYVWVTKRVTCLINTKSTMNHYKYPGWRGKLIWIRQHYVVQQRKHEDKIMRESPISI